MFKNVFAIALLSVCVLSSAGCSRGETISLGGSSCRLKELIEDPTDIGGMSVDEKVLKLNLRCSEVTEDGLRSLITKGEFSAPDGRRFKTQLGNMLFQKEGGLYYSLVVAVPKDVDVGTVKFVFDNQAISLKKN